jgi:ribosomal protein S18 acetylase RimI-like enzyme
VSVKIASIRPATPDDEAFVLSLAARFAETRPRWRTADEVEAGTARVLSGVLRTLSPDDALFVAEDSGEPVGFVYVYAERDFFTGEAHAHISEIAVSADGTGAGRALMAAAEEWAYRRGYRYVSLHVSAPNERAKAFYERLGYDLEWSRLNKRLQ